MVDAQPSDLSTAGKSVNSFIGNTFGATVLGEEDYDLAPFFLGGKLIFIENSF